LFSALSVNESARQLRQYGWDANLAVSIVTNFRQFVVYDCTSEPLDDDTAHVGRIRYLSLNDLKSTGFDYLWEKFGYDNVCRSGWEKYTRKNSRFPKPENPLHGSDLISAALRAKIERLMKKYRPKSYQEIVGNAKTIRQVLQAANKINGFDGLLFMFLGETGCGKTLLADMIAREINGNTNRVKCMEDTDVKNMIDRIWGNITPDYNRYSTKIVIVRRVHQSACKFFSILAFSGN
jgi:hypothetical protein